MNIQVPILIYILYHNFKKVACCCFEFYWLMMVFTFVLIGSCDYFGVGISKLN